jgi:hypothetical protein
MWAAGPSRGISGRVTAARTITRIWAKDDPFGTELAEISIGDGALTARSFAIGSDPEPYRLELELTTTTGYATSRLLLHATGQGWWRRLVLDRARSGEWSASTDGAGGAHLGAPGGDMAAIAGALDCDVGLSPVTNTMPVLRHRLHEAEGAHDFVMAWVSVPDLRVTPSMQRYTHVAREANRRVVRFNDPTFQAEIDFDENGIVADYPGIARRIS